MIDTSLREHWEREQAARTRLRNSLPRSWRDDPRPKMDDVRELYVEAMLEMHSPARIAVIGDDDR